MSEVKFTGSINITPNVEKVIILPGGVIIPLIVGSVINYTGPDFNITLTIHKP